MAGIMDTLGGLLGGPKDDMMSGLLGEDALRNARNMGLLSAAAQLLQAGGPQYKPTSIGQALGSAYQAGQGAYNTAIDTGLKGALTAEQVRKLQEERKRRELLSGIMGDQGGASVTPGADAILNGGGAPVGGMGTAPGMPSASAAPSGGNVTREWFQSRIAKLSKAGLFEEANRLSEAANRMFPEETFSQDIRYVKDKNGKDIAVQVGNRGTIRPLDGYSPTMSPYESAKINQDNYQMVDSGDGFVFANKKTREVTPAVGPDGQQIESKLKPVPATVVETIAQNRDQLRKIDQAIGLLETNPNATGAKAYLPNALVSRMDPEGVDTRAAVADIGSLKIKDRSGATVTAAESPRLLPFIPLPNDRADINLKKIKRLREEIEAINNDVEGYYSRDNGFRGVPKSNTTTAPTITNYTNQYGLTPRK